MYILFAPWQTVFDNWNYSHFGYAVIDFFGLAHFFGEQTINGAWWYLAVLLLCYILTPIFLLFLRRAPIFLTSVIIFLAVIAKNYDLILISTYAVGMLLHRFELLDRMVRWTENAKAWQACLSAIFFLLSAGLLAFARQQTVFYTILSLAILFACLVMEKCAKCVCNLLAVYGVHSANIYFFHVFLYEKNFPNLVYAPKTPLLIFPVFAISCFLISLLIEWIKKGIRLNTFLSWCCNKAVELTAGKEKNVF